jgi:hypothetical protein
MIVEQEPVHTVATVCGDLTWVHAFVTQGLVTDPVLIRATDDGEALLTTAHVKEAHRAHISQEPDRMRLAIQPLARVADAYRDGRVKPLDNVGREDILAFDDTKQAPLILAYEIFAADALRNAVTDRDG